MKRLSPTRRSAMNLASATIGADRIQPLRSNSLSSVNTTSSSTQLSSSSHSRSGPQTLAKRSLSDVPMQLGSDREKERDRDRKEYQQDPYYSLSSASFSPGSQNAPQARASEAAEHPTTPPRRVIRRSVKDRSASNRTVAGVRASNVGEDAFDDYNVNGGRGHERATARKARQPALEQEGKYSHREEEDARGSRNGFRSSSLRKLPNEREEEVDMGAGAEEELPGPAGYSLDNLEDDIVDVDESDRVPCPNCGRKFAGEDRLEKHVIACSKSKSKRKVFDATKARVKGTELEQYVMKKGHNSEQPSKQKKQNAENTPIQPKKAGWRVKHENFIKMVRSNRNVGGGSNEPAPTYEPDPDLVQCQHCSRRFNESAAERHIPICANTKHKPKAKLSAGLQNPKDIVVGAPDEALRKRMSFKPPPPKTKAKK
ncbi:hypothetical protein HK101_004032 [Irineochytrium annulatum]|nr:hypothetical protein HK101_004032 [Irineochytrium annulatum]